MKMNKGRLVIAGSLILTALLWWFASPMEAITILDRLSHLIAGLSLTGLCLVFVMSTRNRAVEKSFGGLDVLYHDHKWLAIFSVVLIFIHGRISESISEAESVGEVVKSTSALLGTIGQLLFILFVLIALFAKRLKYEQWRFFHRLLVIPHILGIYHTYASSKYELFVFTPLALWVGLTTIIGISAGLYTILIYQRTAFDYKGTVSEVTYLNGNTLKIELKLDKPMKFTSGQYVFIKVFQKDIDRAPHPFTIAGGTDDTICLTVKKLGDGTTEMYDRLKTGTDVKLDGPYGLFDVQKGKQKQLWIAGGIGITSFISYLEDFEGRYDGFHVYFHDTALNPRLNITDIDLKEDMTVYICGPVNMIKQYSKTIRKAKKISDIRYEKFEFAR